MSFVMTDDDRTVLTAAIDAGAVGLTQRAIAQLPVKPKAAWVAVQRLRAAGYLAAGSGNNLIPLRNFVATEKGRRAL